ncbi:MAG: ThuA domain-containing protein [Candidatus Methylacidiphilales bacterium]
MKKLRILLVTGGGWHDFAVGKQILSKQFAGYGYDVETTEDLERLTQSLDNLDVLVFYTQGGALTDAQFGNIEKFVSAGGGLVGVHCGNDSFLNWSDRSVHTPWRKLLGSHFYSHPPVLFYKDVVTNAAHQLLKGLPALEGNDELYQSDVDADCDVFLSARYQGKLYPMAYTKTHGEGRVFYTAHGHWPESLNNAGYAQLLGRGIRWAAKDWSDASAKPLRWGVVGYGGAFNMGKHHLDHAVTAGIVAAGATDLDPKRVAIAKTDFPEITTYPSLADMVKDPNIDGVTIITPHSAHAANVIEALNAGKHVVTEKPMAITAAECDEMIAAAKANGKMLSVYHSRRWDNDWLVLEGILRSGKIGAPYYIEGAMHGFGRPGGEWWRDDKTISGGVMHDWGAHNWFWIQRMLTMFGPAKIEEVTGFFSRRVWHHVTNEDLGLAIVRYDGNRMAKFECGQLCPEMPPKFRIFGPKGFIELHWGWGDCPKEKQGVISVYEYVNGKPVLSRVRFDKVPSTWGDFYVNIANHLTHGEPLEITAEEARTVIAIIDTAHKSAAEGKSLPLL